VQEYTQARIKECMLKPEFGAALKTSDAHLYMQMLREQIVDELKLSHSGTVKDFMWPDQ